MEDLFSQLAKSKAPLADRCAPHLGRVYRAKHVGPWQAAAPRHRGGQPDLQHFLGRRAAENNAG